MGGFDRIKIGAAWGHNCGMRPALERWRGMPMTPVAQDFIEAVDEAAARAMLPKLAGLLLFDQSEKMHKAGFGESWCYGQHIIERAREAQGLLGPKSR